MFLYESHFLRLPGGLMFHHGVEDRQQWAHAGDEADFPYAWRCSPR